MNLLIPIKHFVFLHVSKNMFIFHGPCAIFLYKKCIFYIFLPCHQIHISLKCLFICIFNWKTKSQSSEMCQVKIGFQWFGWRRKLGKLARKFKQDNFFPHFPYTISLFKLFSVGTYSISEVDVEASYLELWKSPLACPTPKHLFQDNDYESKVTSILSHLHRP